MAARAQDDFYFVQLSDTHWGFKGPAVNPDAEGTLKKAVAAVNALPIEPDFIVFTGDLTHTTDDPKERRRRLAEFRDIVGALKNKNVRFMPGEHDASLDHGEAWKEFFGPSTTPSTTRACTSSPSTTSPIRRRASATSSSPGSRPTSPSSPTDAPIVVLTHRPLFDLYPQWDWATRDGAAGDRAADAATATSPCSTATSTRRTTT